MANDQDETRLPKWAQTQLAVLRGDLEATKRKLDIACGVTSEPSNTYVWGSALSDDKPLPPFTPLRFVLGKGRHQVVDVRVSRSDPDTLVIQAGAELALYPRVTNVVEVKVVR